MIKLLSISLFLIFINSTNVNQNMISGKVLDKNTREELAGVRIISDCDTVYSDFNGCFIIKHQSGITKLQFNLISYEPDDLMIINNNKSFLVKK